MGSCGMGGKLHGVIRFGTEQNGREEAFNFVLHVEVASDWDHDVCEYLLMYDQLKQACFHKSTLL